MHDFKNKLYEIDYERDFIQLLSNRLSQREASGLCTVLIAMAF